MHYLTCFWVSFDALYRKYWMDKNIWIFFKKEIIKQEHPPAPKLKSLQTATRRDFKICLQKINNHVECKSPQFYMTKSHLTRLHFHLRQSTQTSFFSFISFREWPRKMNYLLIICILYITLHRSLKFVLNLYKLSTISEIQFLLDNGWNIGDFIKEIKLPLVELLGWARQWASYLLH